MLDEADADHAREQRPSLNGEPLPLTIVHDSRAERLELGALRAMLGMLRDGVAVIAGREVLFCNEAWRDLTLSRTARSILDEFVEGRPLAVRLLELADSDEKQSVELCVRAGAPDEALLELNASFAKYEDQTCIVAIARDIGPRRQFEAQASRNERLASLGMLVAGVAHEINNPLTYTLGNLESLASRIEVQPAYISQEEAREAMRDAIDGCQRIATIIRELRSFHRSDEQKIALLDPNRVIRDAVRIVAPKCASVARLETDLEEVPAVLGLEIGLAQVLINLIVNAIDAMPERDVGENVVRISSRRRGADVCIEVADNGRGIPETDLARIFEAFFSRGKPTGTGLGLTISRNLMEQMNGLIEVDSRVGAGTRFTLRLGAAERDRASRVSEPLPAPEASLSEARLLIVDDEPLVARSVARLLSHAGEVTCAHSVASALDMLDARPDIDIVISDWVMPDGGASALIRALALRGRSRLPVVVMTGLGPLAGLPHFDGPCVAKPVSRSELLSAVSQALAKLGERDSMVVHNDPAESASFPVYGVKPAFGAARNSR